MNIIIFDTETIGIDKLFCYNVGYIVLDTETRETLSAKDFIISQIWENKPLFTSAYYADKKKLYVSKMRGGKSRLVNWGYAVNTIVNDCKRFNVQGFYAYNASFDNRVIDYNAEWFKTRNFLDYAPLFDIWGYTSKLIADGNAQEYINFATENNFITESGNLQNNADVWGKFFNGLEWNEEHTALADSKIEKDILLYCLDKNLPLNTNFDVIRQLSAQSPKIKVLTIVYNGNEQKFYFRRKTEYTKKEWKIVLQE